MNVASSAVAERWRCDLNFDFLKISRSKRTGILAFKPKFPFLFIAVQYSHKLISSHIIVQDGYYDKRVRLFRILQLEINIV